MFLNKKLTFYCGWALLVYIIYVLIMVVALYADRAIGLSDLGQAIVYISILASYVALVLPPLLTLGGWIAYAKTAPAERTEWIIYLLATTGIVGYVTYMFYTGLFA